MVYVGPEHRDRRCYFFAAASLLAGTTAFLPAALPPFGFFAPPLLPGPLSGIVSSSVNSGCHYPTAGRTAYQPRRPHRQRDGPAARGRLCSLGLYPEDRVQDFAQQFL